MEEKLVYIKNILAKDHIKLTKPRVLIINFFLENKGHYKPDDIFEIIEKNNHIGIATIYRVLKLLKIYNVIEELSIGKERYYFNNR